MSVLPIKLYRDDVLRQVAKPIPAITDRIRTLAADMIETMYEKAGIGLAGNQVGVAERIIVIDMGFPPEKNKRESLVMINPVILMASKESAIRQEGCLSIPGIQGPVERSAMIKVEYLGIDGESVTMEFGGLRGHCVQHEIDHLDGVLFVDRITPEDKKMFEAYVEQLLLGYTDGAGHVKS